MGSVPNGDTLVALLGIVLCLALVSRSAALERLSGQRKALYGAIWAVVIGLVAAIAARLSG